MGIRSTKHKPQQQFQYNKNYFNFLTICGKGGFGKVWKVQVKKNKHIYALKVMSKAKILTKKSVSSVMNQRDLLTKINNDFIVNMIGAFQDRQYLYLLMDFLNGGDLRYHINRKVRFSQNQIKFIIWCIMEGLEYLHSINIIHRDIKPQNIIFQQKGYCRITDLGVARQWKLQNSNQTSGTPGYMAPEVICHQNHSFCADYFAVGIIAYQLITLKRPYLGKSRKQIRDQILAKQAKLPLDYPNVSPECIDFVNKMIQRKPRNRLGYNGISQIKEHKWLAMKSSQIIIFKNKQLKAPFIPNNQKQNYSKYGIDSQIDENQRYNRGLLPKPQIQELFDQYNFERNNIIDNPPQRNSNHIQNLKPQKSTRQNSIQMKIV